MMPTLTSMLASTAGAPFECAVSEESTKLKIACIRAAVIPTALSWVRRGDYNDKMSGGLLTILLG